MTSARVRSDASALVSTVREVGIEIDETSRRRAEYSYDASNYRVEPLAVVFPRSARDVATVVSLCAEAGIAIIGRGGGTSMAGNAIGRGVVLDFSRHMNRLLAVDRQSRTAVVEPGIVISELQRELLARTDGALTFAPDPSSKTRATVGGAVGNDACGNHSVRYGRTSDHTVAMDVVTAEGHLLRVTRSGIDPLDAQDGAAVEAAERISRELRQLVAENLALFRVELGRIPRQVSGYHLGHLLPENGFDVTRALVGSEGTCVVVVSVTVALVPVPAAARLLCLGYDDVVAAAADVMAILDFSPAAVEGIDDNIARTMEYRRGPDSVRGLPAGNAWLYVDLDGADVAEVDDKAARLLDTLGRMGRLKEGRIVTDPSDRTALWRVREDGAGLATRLASGVESWGGWEDAAVAPENLSAYLADLRSLLEEHGLTGVMYGHFGAGCMHVRITFDQRTEQGRRVMYDFVRAAARVVVEHGGSLSGEHGDGRARSELLPSMYSPRMMDAFSRFKRIWDAQGTLNPGSITDPEPLMDNLMLHGIAQREWRTTFDLHQIGTRADLDPFVHATQSCVGVGRCRTDTGGVMCPSYRATGDEKDSTRGRARVLQEMVRSSPTVADGWASTDVAESLDLCLSCKACSSDCPVGVDMATYKAEFLDHHYAGRLRPLAHYSLGWLPRWLKVTRRVASLTNRVLGSPIGPWLARMGGLTTERALPRFSSTRELVEHMHVGAGSDADVVLVVDTFTRGFRPEVAGAAQRVLEDSGRSAQCRTDVCCGLTWISTGQLSTARKHLTKAVAALDDGTDRPIVVTEPSCAAAFRKDLPELVPSAAARRVAARVQSFAVAVMEQAESGWVPSARLPESVTVQTHCHEYAVFGNSTQRAALASVGIDSVREATGCCGVAGNFGFETRHYELSMAVAEQALGPAVRAATIDTPILTDGFSCHMQVRQLTGDRTASASVHLAQILDPTPPKGPQR